MERVFLMTLVLHRLPATITVQQALQEANGDLWSPSPMQLFPSATRMHAAL